MIDFLEVLRKKREIVWQRIEKYMVALAEFPDYCKPPVKYHSLVKFHQKIVAEYPERKGKYVRPSLTLLTAGAMGFSEKKAIQTAAAMQISEDWILNHDDIEDNSLERRGQPALHRLYGSNLAINAGDGLHVLMWKVLIDNAKIIGQQKASQILEEFVRMLNRTVLGQTVEIKWTEENRTRMTDSDVFFILESKTSYYTIAGPMRLGAILAGATPKQLEVIYEFGRYLGRAFQIRDDLLDLTSDFAGLKKQMGNDIYEGKRTIMLVHLLRTAKGEDKKKLMKIIKKTRDEKTATEVKWVIKMMKKYGSLEYGKKLAEKLAKKAETIFEEKLGFLSRQPYRSQLRAGIKFMIERSH